MEDLQYVGFWARFWATVVDVIIWMILIYPIFYLIYGSTFIERANDFNLANNLINYILPFIAIILLWKTKGATPGKMFIKATIVDEESLTKPGTKQLVIRYFAYILSAIPLFLGYFWAGWDKRKQTWHDKLAGTVVVQPKVEKKTKSIGSYLAIAFGGFAVVVFGGILVLGIMLQSGLMPDGDLYDAKKLPKDVRTTLLKEGVLKEEEHIRYYQPHSLFDFTGSATFFTDTSIRYFDTDEQGEVLVWDFPLSKIEKLGLEIEPFILDIDTFTMTLYDAQGKEEFSVGLSPKSTNSQKIKIELMELWNNARN